MKAVLDKRALHLTICRRRFLLLRIVSIAATRLASLATIRSGQQGAGLSKSMNS